MNVLIIGSGGREHALALSIARSPLLSRLFIAPGNPGAALVAEAVAIEIADHGAVVDFCRLFSIGLVVVGPEAPLVAGLADDLAAAGIACFGPSRAAARLEGSKGFAKDFCRDFGIPTAAYRRFDRDRFGDQRGARIAGRDEQSAQQGRACDRERQGMFPAARPDDQDIHAASIGRRPSAGFHSTCAA
jgi:hypothetical protein